MYSLQADVFSEISKAFKSSVDASQSMGLFINKLAILGSQYCVNFVNFINNSLYAESIPISYTYFKDYKKEEDLRILKEKEFLEILKMVDYSIIDIEIDEEHPFINTIIKRKKTNGEIFTRELRDDSSGVMEFFAWAVQIYRVVYENKVVFADEMDRVLNSVLSDHVISFINGKNHTGQFIITTHNAMHLDLKKYMKEQIYFVTKNLQTLNSELYGLVDFPEVRYENTKIHDLYMKGLLGGTSDE